MSVEERIEEFMRDRLREEVPLHDTDILYGAPFDIGLGITIAMHSASCRRCGVLTNVYVCRSTVEAAKKRDREPRNGT